ncbi:hypothetical protein PQS31_03710 [Luteimonas sp BLCC-B24]|uniref:hypothetical protein n=1 Tax=Luteimonas sp. BLCC-B24 TaxID=3025317 RepID=UPI00234D7460|nr:hypothetical protein [Luteimonas sp. BLCC-B24]MDC7805928.1 hypothetical protein [Luteimonas sp. BLCC-B24]
MGLVQALLVLILVGGAVTAGAVLLQAKRAPAQAVSQEQALRWADEAVAAFASTHARLPCPARTLDGDEDCSSGHAKGWLPARTLLGAAGNGMRLGPMAYMVYRGDEAAHLDLTRPGNVYRPPLTDGTPRTIGDDASSREFTAVNGLDLCRTLELAELAGTDTDRAHVEAQDSALRNVAYGIAAAGPHAGSDRLDDRNAGAAHRMDAPWREWDSGYDDRVRVRSFAGVGHTLGCRLLTGRGGAAPAYAPFSGIPFLDPAATPAAPYNVSLAGMDVLAAAVTLHDALALLQETNIEATEKAVQGAAFAQVSLIFKLVTTAVSLSDQITTLVTSATSLTRSIATCIASLGTMCWEVPLKTAAVVTSIVGLGTKGVTLAAKAASLPFVALALDASIKARDLARKSQTGKVPQDLDEARRELECTLYARNCDDSTQREVVYRRDGDGNPIQRRNADGSPMYDDRGNPLYEIESETVVPRIGLDRQTELARAQWQTLQFQVDMLERWRLAPWGVASRASTNAQGEPLRDGNGMPVYDLVEIQSLGHDGQSRSQIQQRIDPYRTCGLGSGSSDWRNCSNTRYRKQVEHWVCRSSGQGGGLYDAACNYVGTRTANDADGNPVVVNAGTHDRVRETTYHFDWDVATADAVARRRKTEEWIDLNKRDQELDKEITQFRNNIDTWFTGNDSILSKMLTQLNDAQHCAGRGRGDPANPEANLPGDEMQRQQCINARNAVRYIEHCEKPVTVTECRFVGNGTGRYSDSACSNRTGTPKDYIWQERSSGVFERDTNELATCRPNMEARLSRLVSEKTGLATRRDAARDAYNALPTPWVAYPGRDQPYAGDSSYNWFEWAIETVEDQDGNPLRYDWVRSRFTDTYTYVHTYPCKKKETQRVRVPGNPAANPPTSDSWINVEVEVDSTCSETRTATRSLPWYATEHYGNRDASAPLLVTSSNELLPKSVCQYFTGRAWNGSLWWWPNAGNANWWNRNAYDMGVYCQRYPYSRAFEDWRRAKTGADNARKNYDDTLAQFNKLKEELDNMNGEGASSGGPTTQMSFGAEATLEHADSRGSTGTQAAAVTP